MTYKNSIIIGSFSSPIALGRGDNVRNSRAFETVTGVGFLKMVQSIFDAGRYFSRTSNVSVKEIIPSPITISRHID
ncbi:unnamed protein product [Rotaria magnacalcarata]|uniref:Hermes trasposase DNA-binding domain-containing protein n=1 Tax=Rotaria magnacalcarata TaxID=392030 RepID=A0A816T7D9_9BILA|nr:unnamed protein product [Rotaria magnacalcarata]